MTTYTTVDRRADGQFTINGVNEDGVVKVFVFRLGWSATIWARENTFANLDKLDDVYKAVRRAVWDFEAQRVMQEKKIVKMTTKAHWDKKLERWTERTIVTHEGGLPSAVDVQTAMDKSKAKMEKTITAMQKDMARIQKELAEVTT